MSIATNITFFQDEDVVITDTIKNPPSGGIAAWTIRFTMRQDFGQAVVLQKDMGLGVNILDPIAGTFLVGILATDTKAMTAGTYVYDIKRIDNSFNTVISNGKAELYPAVTLN